MRFMILICFVFAAMSCGPDFSQRVAKAVSDNADESGCVCNECECYDDGTCICTGCECPSAGCDGDDCAMGACDCEPGCDCGCGTSDDSTGGAEPGKDDGCSGGTCSTDWTSCATILYSQAADGTLGERIKCL